LGENKAKGSQICQRFRQVVVGLIARGAAGQCSKPAENERVRQAKTILAYKRGILYRKKEGQTNRTSNHNFKRPSFRGKEKSNRPKDVKKGRTRIKQNQRVERFHGPFAERGFDREEGQKNEFPNELSRMHSNRRQMSTTEPSKNAKGAHTSFSETNGACQR